MAPQALTELLARLPTAASAQTRPDSLCSASAHRQRGATPFPSEGQGGLAGWQWGRCPQQRHIPRTWPLTRGLLGTASGEWGLGSAHALLGPTSEAVSMTAATRHDPASIFSFHPSLFSLLCMGGIPSCMPPMCVFLGMVNWSLSLCLYSVELDCPCRDAAGQYHL